MKKILLLVLSLLIISPISANASVQKACPKNKINQINKFGEKCIKVGNTYRWIKSINNEQTISQKPNPTPTVSVESNNSNKQQNVETINKTISENAFNKIKNANYSDKVNNFIVNSFISNNINQELLKIYQKQFDTSLRLFDNKITHKQNVHAYFITHTDYDILKENSEKLYDGMWIYESTKRYIEYYIKSKSPNDRSPGGTASTIGSRECLIYGYSSDKCKFFLVLVVFNHEQHTAKDIVWELVPHETSHLYQHAMSLGIPKQNFYLENGQYKEKEISVYCHTFEGAANTLGIALASSNYEQYEEINKQINKRNFVNINKKDLDIFKTLQKTESWLDDNCHHSATVGSYFYEWIIDKYGIEKFFELYDNIDKFKKEEIAIEKTFSVSITKLYSESIDYIKIRINI